MPFPGVKFPEKPWSSGAEGAAPEGSYFVRPVYSGFPLRAPFTQEAGGRPVFAEEPTAGPVSALELVEMIERYKIRTLGTEISKDGGQTWADLSPMAGAPSRSDPTLESILLWDDKRDERIFRYYSGDGAVILSSDGRSSHFDNDPDVEILGRMYRRFPYLVSLTGRLATEDYLSCADCGHLTLQYRLQVPRSLTMIAATTALGTALSFRLSSETWVHWLAFVASSFLVWLATKAILSVVYADRVSRLRLGPCPSCGSSKWRPLTGSPLDEDKGERRCPLCKQMTLISYVVGRT